MSHQQEKSSKDSPVNYGMHDNPSLKTKAKKVPKAKNTLLQISGSDVECGLAKSVHGLEISFGSFRLDDTSQPIMLPPRTQSAPPQLAEPESAQEKLEHLPSVHEQAPAAIPIVPDTDHVPHFPQQYAPVYPERGFPSIQERGFGHIQERPYQPQMPTRGYQPAPEYHSPMNQFAAFSPIPLAYVAQPSLPHHKDEVQSIRLPSQKPKPKIVIKDPNTLQEKVFERTAPPSPERVSHVETPSETARSSEPKRIEIAISLDEDMSVEDLTAKDESEATTPIIEISAEKTPTAEANQVTPVVEPQPVAEVAVEAVPEKETETETETGTEIKPEPETTLKRTTYPLNCIMSLKNSAHMPRIFKAPNVVVKPRGAEPRRGRGGFGRDGRDSRDLPRDSFRRSYPTRPEQIYVPSENRWKRTKATEKDEILLRSLRSILNKLSFEHFRELSDDILKLGIDQVDILQDAIDVIFAKAIDEPNFSALYAELCSFLTLHLRVQGEDELERNTEPGKTYVPVFRRALLDKCRESYDERESWNESADKDRTQPPSGILTDEDYARIKAKRRYLGNIQFFGELFNKDVLHYNVIERCFMDLIGDMENPDEESVECACKLVKTVGPRLDTLTQYSSGAQAVFSRLQTLSTNSKLGSRVRFMILDLIDLRRARWVDPKKAKPAPAPSSRERERDREPRDMERDRGRAFHPAPSREISRKGSDAWSSSKSTKDNKSRLERQSSLPQSQNALRTSTLSPNLFGALISDHRSEDESHARPSAEKEVLEEDVRKATEFICSEFQSSRDLKTTKEYIEERISSSARSMFVQMALEISTLNSKDASIVAGELISELMTSKHIAANALVGGIKEYFSIIEDLEMDAPKIFENIGALLGVLVSKGHSTLKMVQADFLVPVADSQEKISSMFRTALTQMSEAMRPSAIGKEVTDAGLSLEKISGKSSVEELKSAIAYGHIRKNIERGMFSEAADILNTDLKDRPKSQMIQNIGPILSSQFQRQFMDVVDKEGEAANFDVLTGFMKQIGCPSEYVEKLGDFILKDSGSMGEAESKRFLSEAVDACVRARIVDQSVADSLLARIL